MNEFKRNLELLCEIAEWEPSEQQLLQVRNEILRVSKQREITENDVKIIVCDLFPDATYFCMEGVDTKDVETLLALLLKATEEQK
ncbi:hypothetical protein CGI23_24675 [Vibrio parahaemolyticus]|uniref:hypothetical protein n=1 Tax=Vibrio parahaemolyticus TaxID=670 RepID=UPI00111F1356|nr:hypothetical protein [Vibrio parahaemolyticus]TOK18067.1 hypothetical protein CGI23_24675 [Vibrio parahaemolyticus]